MCLIVDANAAGDFLAKAGLVTDWLLGRTGNPRLVAGGRLRFELARLSEVHRLLLTLERAGRLISPDEEKLTLLGRDLKRAATCKSDDHHVLALAIVSGARTLATFDNDLAADFRNSRIIKDPRGHVYRDPTSHAHLLAHTPSSCGVRSTKSRKRSR